MLVKDAMTRWAERVAPGDSLEAAAQAMRTAAIGALVVCERDRPVGLITDRDIVVRGVALGLDPERTPVCDVMTPQVFCCCEDDDLLAAAALMEERAVRRVAVLDAEERLVGMLSVDDLALVDRALAGAIIEHARAPEPPVAGDAVPAP